MDTEIQDRQERARKWESLLPRYISAFEAMVHDIRAQLVTLPMIAKRRKEVGSLSFQQIGQAEESIRKWFGIEIFFGLKPEDQRFLNREFNRRHLLVHRAGRVDDEYLQKTGDTSVKLHQSIRVQSSDVARLAKLLFQCAQNFFEQFSSIS